MLKLKRLLTITAIAVFTGLCALSVPRAMPRANADGPYKIVLIAGIASDPFYITMNHGAQAEAQKEGATVQYSGSSAAFSPSTQLPYLNAAIAQKPDLILIAPTDKVALQAPIAQAVAAHIPIILVDTTLNDPSIAVTTISSDNIAGGEKVADALAGAIGKTGKVAVVGVTPGISTTDDRVTGFNRQLATYPEIKNLGVTYTGDNPTRANTVLKGLVAANRDLAGVFATNTQTGNGATAAARELGLSGKLKLVEFDTEPVQVEGVKAGTVAALVAQDPYSMGELGVRYGVQYLKGKRDFDKHYGTGEAIITKANVDSEDMKKYLYAQ
jgi:ribose transport system substrate-binding protein